MGRLAAPALAFLGDAAASLVHVRVNGLGSLSLRGRCFCRSDYRDAGLRSRCVDHEEERRRPDVITALTKAADGEFADVPPRR